MTPRDRAARAARQAWGAVRGRIPGADPALSTVREQLRTPDGRARRVADLARRVHELERDQALLATQLSAVQAIAGAGDPIAVDVADRITAARLEAIALYEHRIGELERLVLRRRDTPGRRGAGRTAGEHPVQPS